MNRHRLVYIHFFCLLIFSAIKVYSEEKVQWYSETHQQSTQRVFSQSSQLRYFLPFNSYGMIGINHLSTPGHEGQIDAAAHFFGEVGWHFSKHRRVKIFAGLRYKYYYGEETSWQRQTAKLDWRILYVNGEYKEFGKQYFVESYWESLFSSADNNNLITTTFYRFGIMAKNGSWRWDFFTSPVFKFDRIGHFYYNLASWELMARISRSFPHWVISLYTGASFDHYIQRHMGDEFEKEVNPYHRNQVNGKILLTIGSW